MARRPRGRPRAGRARPCAVPDRGPDRQGAPLGRLPAVLGQHRVYQHDPRRQAGPPARRLQHRADDPARRPLERNGDGRARQQEHERRRSHRKLRVCRDALRHRVQPLLACAHRRARGRPRVRSGALGAGRVRAGVHARPVHARADGQLPAGSRRQGHLVVSAPVADAGLLAIPDRVDGPRPADGDLPGTLHEVPAGSRPRADRGPQGVGVHGRRRNGRARIDGRDQHGRAREPGQPDLRRQLQPAAPRRSRARQRQDHPGARERLPRRRLERDQGHLGAALGSAPRARQEGPPDAPDDGGRRRRIPDVQEQGRRVRSRVFLQYPGAEGARGRLLGRRHLEVESRRPRSVQGVQRVPRRGEPQGTANGHPCEDDQGLRHGRVGRGAEHHAPAEEALGRVDPALPRPLRDRGPGRQAARGAVRHVSGRLARARVHARAPDGPGRVPAGAAAAGEPAGGTRAVRIRAVPQEHRGPRDLDDDDVRAGPADAAARQEPRQAHRANRPRRIADLRHGGDVPAARHLEPAGPALHAGGFRPADVLQGVEERPDPAGRDQRSGRHVRLDRRSDVVLARTACR